VLEITKLHQSTAKNTVDTFSRHAVQMLSGGVRTSRHPGHFQITKVVRQVISCEGLKGLISRPVSPEGSESTSSQTDVEYELRLAFCSAYINL